MSNRCLITPTLPKKDIAIRGNDHFYNNGLKWALFDIEGDWYTKIQMALEDAYLITMNTKS